MENFYQDVNLNKNYIKNAKVHVAEELTDPVPLSQMVEAIDIALNAYDPRVALAEDPIALQDISLHDVMQEVTLSQTSFSAKNIYSPTTAIVQNSLESKVDIVYKGRLIQKSFAANFGAITCVEVMGDTVVVMSSAEGTFFYNIENDELFIVEGVDSTKQSVFKYVNFTNSLLLGYVGESKLYEISFNSNYTYVNSTRESDDMPDIIFDVATLIAANANFILLYSHTVFCKIINVDTFTVNTTLSDTAIVQYGSFVTGKIVAVESTYEVISVFAVSANSTTRNMSYINTSGGIIQSNLEFEQFPVDDTVEVHMHLLTKNIVLLQIHYSGAGSIRGYFSYVINVNSNRMFARANTVNRLFPVCDALLSTAPDCYDYTLQEFDSRANNSTLIATATKLMLLGQRSTSELHEGDIITYGEVLRMLQNADFVVSDESFFLKTQVDKTAAITSKSYYATLDPDTMHITVQTDLSSMVFGRSWAAVTTTNGSFFIPVELRLEKYDLDTAASTLEIRDLTSTVFRNRTFSSMTIGWVEGVREPNFVEVNAQHVSQSHLVVIENMYSDELLAALENEFPELIHGKDYVFASVAEVVNEDVSCGILAMNNVIVAENMTVSSNTLNIITSAGLNASLPTLQTKTNHRVLLVASASYDDALGTTTLLSAKNNSTMLNARNDFFIDDDTVSIVDNLPAIRSALTISIIMKLTGCDFAEAVHAITQTSAGTQQFLGYRLPSYAAAVSYITDKHAYYTAVNRKNMLPAAVKNSDLTGRHFINKSNILAVNEDSSFIVVSSKKPTITAHPVGTPFVIGESYAIAALNGDDDFANIGGVTVGAVFQATDTTPTTWLSSVVKKVVSYSSVHSIVDPENLIIRVDEYIDDDGSGDEINIAISCDSSVTECVTLSSSLKTSATVRKADHLAGNVFGFSYTEDTMYQLIYVKNSTAANKQLPFVH